MEKPNLRTQFLVYGRAFTDDEWEKFVNWSNKFREENKDLLDNLAATGISTTRHIAHEFGDRDSLMVTEKPDLRTQKLLYGRTFTDDEWDEYVKFSKEFIEKNKDLLDNVYATGVSKTKYIAREFGES